MDRYATALLSFGATFWIPGVKTERTAKKRRKTEQKWARYGLTKRVRVADLFVMDRYRTNVPPVCVQLPNGRFFPLEWCINRPFDQQIRVSNDSLQCAVWHPQQPNNPTFLARVYGIGLGYGITGAANERKDGVNVRSDGFWICRAVRLANPKRHRYLGTCVAVLSHVGGGEASEWPTGE